MNDKELCRAWRDAEGHFHYVSARGHSHSDRDDTGPKNLDSVAKSDGYAIRWPDGPGVAELVEIVDLWARARAWLAADDPADSGYGQLVARMAHAIGHLRALLDAHDRGEL